MNTIVVLKDWTNNLLIPKHIPCWKMKVPETWEELINFCEEVESRASDVTFEISNDDIDSDLYRIDEYDGAESVITPEMDKNSYIEIIPKKGLQ